MANCIYPDYKDGCILGRGTYGIVYFNRGPFAIKEIRDIRQWDSVNHEQEIYNHMNSNKKVEIL